MLKSNICSVVFVFMCLPLLMSSQKLDKEKKSNANVQNALKQFTFLIGEFEFEGKSLNSSMVYENFKGYWEGNFILDGYAIGDEFMAKDKQGNILQNGITIRAYNAESKRWSMKYFDAIKTTWLTLGQPKFLDGNIYFKSETFGNDTNYQLNISFYDIEDNGFKWKADMSMDAGKTWIENTTIIKAKRKI